MFVTYDLENGDKQVKTAFAFRISMAWRVFLATKSLQFANLQISNFLQNRENGAGGVPIFTEPFGILLAKDFSTLLAHILYFANFQFFAKSWN